MTGGDALDTCPSCGLDLSEERSRRAHNFFHAVIALAFASWPADHPDFHPKDAAHLRAWLCCHPDVDHCDVVAPSVEWRDATEAERIVRYHAFMEYVRAGGGYCFLAERPAGHMILKIPRSTRFICNGGPGRRPFSAIVDRCLSVIQAEAKIERERLIGDARGVEARHGRQDDAGNIRRSSTA